jgi:hypothetical protein
MKLVDRSALKFILRVFVSARVALSAWTFALALLAPTVLQNLDLFGAPTLAVFDLQSSERFAYSRALDDRVLTFRAGARGEVVDAETGSVWNLRAGRAEQGALAGRAFAPAAFSVEEIFPYHGVAPETNLWLALWQRFDANYYVSIAVRGYAATNGDTHFPPAYPILIRWFALGGNYYLGGFVISNLACALALGLFYRQCAAAFDDQVARRATIYLIIFPTAFFFFSAYTESLFLVAALLTLRALERHAWGWAGWWIFCAILIRLQGVALLIPLAYGIWQDRAREKIAARLVALGLPLVALGLFLLVRIAAGESAVVPTSEPNLFARLALPWENYFYAIQTVLSGKFIAIDALNFGITTLCIIALISGWKKLSRPVALYAAASLIVVTMRVVETQPLNSMVRYALTVFPLFMLMGEWGKHAWINRAIVYGSFALGLYLSAQFVMWGWVG